MAKRPVMLSAGGTGGHLFPAQALAEALVKRGHEIELVTDERVLKYGATFPARKIYEVPAATPSGGSIFSKAAAAFTLLRGGVKARNILRDARPIAIVGFGGYPTVPPMLAAKGAGVPAILHEQNAVMGRANAFLAGAVDLIATGFPTLAGVKDGLAPKLRYVGNPLRPAVIAAADLPYPEASPLRVLVTGGSQGARVMSDVVPSAVALLTPEERARLSLVQQARGEDETRVRDAYAKLGFSVEVAPFFADLPARIAASHLVIGRAGASTVSELAAIGRACLLVPFPHALDQDQAANARLLEGAGAATVLKQTEFTPERLAQELREALGDSDTLKMRGDAARAVAVLDAADRLADLVEQIAIKPGA
jgi:UDP-N-acetylglucosamine--N-acetylmuramyl-(pentapeptide) pyrophosphoryl-undecaprenol N-acetylglucosamine transferase